MSAAKPKYWITTSHSNRISHRKLDPFETRNRDMFEMSRRAHKTWTDAHTYVLAQRLVDVANLEHKLKLAKAQLVKAKAMQPPGETP